jgi:hypothetical protein
MKSFKRFGLALLAALVMLASVTPQSDLHGVHTQHLTVAQTAEHNLATNLLNAVAPEAEAAATSNYFQNKVIDATFRAQTALTPGTVYVGLYTGTINAQSCSGEVSGGSYVRPGITSSLANWAGTQGAGTTAASSNATGSSGTTSNNNAITYAAPTATWGSITGFCLYDSSSGGNELIYAPLTTPKTVNSGDSAPSFAAGALTITIGDNGQPDWNRYVRELGEQTESTEAVTA